MLPKISIVIPTYNRADVISRAVESVIHQTYVNWELFIVDDGSTDNTRELVENLYSSDPRITYLQRCETRPKGANACRNIGIENATGTYIGLLDSDDEWKSKHLENCYRFAESKSNFTGSYSSAVVQRGPFLIEQVSRSIKKDESCLDFLIGDGNAMTPTYFLKSKLANDIQFDESLQRHQDWDFFIRFGKKYLWFFNPSIEVIVHRDIKNTFTNIDFKSCVKFYKRYEDQVTMKDLKIKYLLSMYHKAIYTESNLGQQFYEKKLMEVNYFEETISPFWIKHLIFRFQQNKLIGLFKFFIKKHIV